MIQGRISCRLGSTRQARRDPLRANDRSERPVEVASAVPVLLVDGDRGLEPLSSETDFLRAALAPTAR